MGAISPALRVQVEGIRVTYPRWQRIVAEIERCQEWGPVAAEPPCLLVVGPTGAGTSTLVGTYARERPAVLTESGITYPVVRATIPTPATVKALAMVLLAALGDPRATGGTVGAMTYRLTQYFRDCQVELLILDEVQHFRDRDSRRVLENARNWLKTLIKETGVACVLVGLQGEAEEVVGLFGAPRVLLPFTWDERQPELRGGVRGVPGVGGSGAAVGGEAGAGGDGDGAAAARGERGRDGAPDGVAAGGNVLGAGGGATHAG